MAEQKLRLNYTVFSFMHHRTATATHKDFDRFLSKKEQPLLSFLIDNTFYITSSVKNTDNRDLLIIGIGQIVNYKVIYRQLMHSHAVPRFPIH